MTQNLTPTTVATAPRSHEATDRHRPKRGGSPLFLPNFHEVILLCSQSIRLIACLCDCTFSTVMSWIIHHPGSASLSCVRIEEQRVQYRSRVLASRTLCIVSLIVDNSHMKSSKIAYQLIYVANFRQRNRSHPGDATRMTPEANLALCCKAPS